MPSYEVTINGVTYDVESAQELTDAQAYEYARMQADQTPAAPERSLSGFGQNIMESGGRFLKDTAAGIGQLASFGNRLMRAQQNPQAALEMGQDALSVVRNAPAIVSHVGQAAKDRYGSLDAIKNTLYTDPIGALADVSTLAGGVGGAAKITGRFPGVVSKAAMVERVTNPLTLPGMIANKAADVASTGVINMTVRPSAALRKDFPRGTIAQGIKDNRVMTAAQATDQLPAAYAAAEDLITSRRNNGTGVRGSLLGPDKTIPVDDIVSALKEGDRSPMQIALEREQLGHPGISEVQQRIDDIRQKRRMDVPVDTPDGVGTDTFFNDYTLPEAQRLKRQAQRLAYDKDANTLSSEMDKAIARKLQASLENRVPGLADKNRTTQQLIAVEQALRAAEDRPGTLTHQLAAALLASGFGVGHSVTIPAAMAMEAFQHPRFGAAAGIGINEMGRLASTSQLQQALLAARAAGLTIDEELVMELLRRQMSPVASH